MTHIISKPQQHFRSCCLKEVTPFTDEDTGITKCLISVNTASKWEGQRFKGRLPSSSAVTSSLTHQE